MVTTQQKLKKYLSEIEKNDQKGNKINAFLQINPNALQEAKEIDSKIKRLSRARSASPKLGQNKEKLGRLAGKIISVKAIINVKGLNTSCGSKTLENYKATYDAWVIKKIKDEDGLIIGMTNCDEFACGSSGETSAFGPTLNPKNLKLIPGGSSSGSAASVSAGMCDMSLGSDTGGSIRNPASHCGIIGIKPTYSSVSRYGLIDLSMSLDQIGPLAKNIVDASLLLSVISGKDENDSISQESPKLNLNEIEKIPKNITLGILDFEIKDKRIQEIIDDKIKIAAEKYNWKVKKIKLNYIDLAVEIYYLLVYVEFFSATRRFDGRKYGQKIEDVAGPEVLRRILGGAEISKSEYHGRYYYQALKIKKLIEKEFDRIFGKVDCVISPTVPQLPHGIGKDVSIEEMYGYDLLTIPSNLAGNCAISIPVGEILEVPVGMQIICDKFQEQKLLQLARAFEKL